jgi:hypothetical protein
MFGGEHLKERISERLQHLQNQPKHRGYLPGCHLRTGDTEGRAGYSVKTLQGNWAEERRDAAFCSDKPALPTDLEKTWQTTYRTMTSGVAPPSDTANFSQSTLIEIVDGAHRAFPGHQPQVAPEADRNIKLSSTTRSTFVPPSVLRAAAKESLPSVAGGTPGAQARGISLRLRHHLLSQPSGIFTRLRRALAAADTSGRLCLNSKEAARGLQQCGVPATETETGILIESLDRTGRREVPVMVLVADLRGALTERRLVLVEKAFRLLQKLSPKGFVRLSTILSLYDASSHPDVKAGKTTADQAKADFAWRWDAQDPNAIIELQEFVDYYTDVSGEISSDIVFEQTVRNTWHVSGGDGRCKNTSCITVRIVHTNGRVTQRELVDDLGIDRGDQEKILANLAAQHVTDIASVEAI